jgi:hypothetical protein
MDLTAQRVQEVVAAEAIWRLVLFLPLEMEATEVVVLLFLNL